MNITLQPSQNLWVTTDWHLGHKNIIRSLSRWPEGGFRDFDSISEMDSCILDNLNRFVLPDDILFHLGDWSFGGFENIELYRKRVNCQNIHIIPGNHDKHILNNRGDVQDLFSSVNDWLDLTVEGIGNFKLSHLPLPWWTKDWIHLHGHWHSFPGEKLGPGKSLDVSLEGNNYKPYNLHEIVDLMKDR